MLYAIAMVCILILDQAMKYWTILNIVPDEGVKAFIPGVVELVNVHNTGAAFGLLENGRWFFVILTAVLAVVVLVLLARDIITGKLARFSLLAILAGGIGNCIDRLLNGYVVDMFSLEFMSFPVFNVADIFVTVFGIIFCICLISGKVVDKEEIIAVLPGTKTPEHSKNVDYLTQLKKPVVMGKEAIESELAAHNSKTAVIRPEDTGFGTWNMPEDIKNSAPAPAPKAQPAAFVDPFADAKTRPQAPGPLSEAGRRPAAPAPLSKPADSPSPASPPKAASPGDPFKETAKAPAKDSDFSIDDIIAEFKD